MAAKLSTLGAMPQRLPLHDQLPALLETLQSGRTTLLSAPPGAGKSTLVPGAVADQSWCAGRVLVSQPRRLAAQALARRVAAQRGTKLGGEVGYSVRFDRQVSAATRVEFVTAGLLLRRIQSDPFLDGVDCVILDEFHERSLDSDLSLALLLQVQAEARPDLRLVIMSATLDVSALERRLPDAAQVRTSGRSFPVEIEHLRRDDDAPIATAAARAALRALSPSGRVLVFLPGVGSIERCRRALADADVSVLPLHGRLSAREQQRVLTPCVEPQIILATNLAQTSLTIDGVHTVVDSGLERAMRYDPRLGVSRLTTVPISRASAEQRAGRAGRLGSGRCVRLWSQASHHQRAEHDDAEVANAELSSSLLQILSWGQALDDFAWFEAPPAAHVRRACWLLETLDALSAQGKLTATGRQLATLPIEPRLGAVLLRGAQLGHTRLACEVAAIASEPDFLRHPPPERCDDDLQYRLEQLEAPQGPIDAHGRARVQRVAQQLERLAPKAAPRREDTAHLLQDLLLAGFSDRLARRSDDGSYVLAAGFQAKRSPRSRCAPAEVILAVNLNAQERHTPLIEAALPVALDRLERRHTLELRWDPQRAAVMHERCERIGTLVLKRSPAHEAPDPVAVARVLFEALENQPERALNWDTKAQALVDRLRFCRQHGADELPDPNDSAQLLKAICAGRRSLDELRRADLAQALTDQLSYPMRQTLADWAPTHFKLPSGRSARVDYANPSAPALRARLQDFFGLEETPRLAQGRASTVCHLLAPNGRPAQVTSDLAGFWRGSYAEVRKALRGRYPKHDWPEQPHLRNSS